MTIGSPKCVSAATPLPFPLHNKDHDDLESASSALHYVRVLTRPFLTPPAVAELKEALVEPWKVRIPVDTGDATTWNHWKDQPHTPLFHQMFDWKNEADDDASASSCSTRVSLAPYLVFGNDNPVFFQPWQDVGHCLQNLMFHRVGASQTLFSTLALSSHDQHVFLATNSNVCEHEAIQQLHVSPQYYLLRCHYDKSEELHHDRLVFGYHRAVSDQDDSAGPLVPLHVVDLIDNDDWRLQTCIIITNMARILHALQDFALPLTSQPDKRSLVTIPIPMQLMMNNTINHTNSNNHTIMAVQKAYPQDQICGIFQATVTNMIHMYQLLDQHHVPHTDRLVSVQKDAANESVTVCQFAPVGRSYLPENCTQLLQAVVCVTRALTHLHAIGMMHRDIRWANVFHALVLEDRHEDEPDDTNHNPRQGECFTDKWVLFDFEFAAWSPQRAFLAPSLTPDNHAPEMIVHSYNRHTIPITLHNTAVDIWGLGYLLRHAHVAVPLSHRDDVMHLQEQCLQSDPGLRPTARECLEILLELQARPQSTELNIVEWP